MATNLVAKMGQNYLPPALIAVPFRNGMGYHNRYMRVSSVNDASILCENFMKFGPVTPEIEVREIVLLKRYGKKTAYLTEYLNY